MQGTMLSINENARTVALTASLLHDAEVMSKSLEEQAACRSLLALRCVEHSQQFIVTLYCQHVHAVLPFNLRV